MYGTGPHYLSELLCRRTTRPGLRSANSLKLYIQQRNQGRNEAQQTVRFQFLDPNCGTSFHLPFRTAAALMFLNLDLKHFYS